VAAERNDKLGKWVYRNQRWYFVQGEAGYFDYEPRSVDKEALAALVDVAELIVPIRTGLRVFKLPVLVVLLPQQDVLKQHAGAVPGIPEGCSDFLQPDWWEQMEEESASLAGSIQDEMRRAVLEVMESGTPVELCGPWGEGSVVAEPIAFGQGERQFLYGAVAAPIVGREAVSGADAGWLASTFGVGEQEASRGREILLNGLPDFEVAAGFRRILGLHVSGYSARVGEAYAHRVALAGEQARNRHYLLKVESLERQLLRGTTEFDRARRRTGIKARELTAILENPAIGITIEDTNHVVRYANPMIRQAFGNVEGRRCYEALKGRTGPCEICPLVGIWEQGKESVRYTSVDSRSGRHFEVLAFPLVGQDGEKLIVEAGIDITRLTKQRRELEGRIEGVLLRNEQLSRLLERVNRVLLELTGDVGNLLVESFLFGESRSSTAEWIETEVTSDRVEKLNVMFMQLSSAVNNAGQVALALASTQALTDVDVSLLCDRLAGELEHGLSGIRVQMGVAVMPAVRSDPLALGNVLSALMRHLADADGGEVVSLEVSHTMSGRVSELAKGDAYHVLSVSRRPPDNSGESLADTVSEVGAAGESANAESDVNLTIASLLVQRLGGELWEGVSGSGDTVHYFTLPVNSMEAGESGD